MGSCRKKCSTIYQVEKELRSKLIFTLVKNDFISALTGQRVDNIFEHALNAVNHIEEELQHL